MKPSEFDVNIGARLAEKPSASPDVSILVDLDDPAVRAEVARNAGCTLVRMQFRMHGLKHWAWVAVRFPGFETTPHHGVVLELQPGANMKSMEREVAMILRGVPLTVDDTE